MNPILENEWELEDYKVEILGGGFFLGMFFGNILAGYVSDIIGRRWTIIISTFI